MKTAWCYQIPLIFKLPNVSNNDASSIYKRLGHRVINKHNEELQHVLKGLGNSDRVLSKQVSAINFFILKKSTISNNSKSLLKLLYTQQKNLSSLKRVCILPIFSANKTITNLTQYEIFHEESEFLKADLYFPI